MKIISQLLFIIFIASIGCKKKSQDKVAADMSLLMAHNWYYDSVYQGSNYDSIYSSCYQNCYIVFGKDSIATIHLEASPCNYRPTFEFGYYVDNVYYYLEANNYPETTNPGAYNQLAIVKLTDSVLYLDDLGSGLNFVFRAR